MTDKEFVETRLRFEALDADSVGEATKLRLTIEGEAETVWALGDFVLAVIGPSAEEVRAEDDKGNEIPLGPPKIDPLSTGDDAVA